MGAEIANTDLATWTCAADFLPKKGKLNRINDLRLFRLQADFLVKLDASGMDKGLQTVVTVL